MSSITFPHGGHLSAASSSSENEPSYFPSPFDTSSRDSFQMNPLSSHPPRTPRTSIISSGSQHYSSEVYAAKDEVQSEQQADDASDDEDEKAQEAAKSRVPREEVWRDLLKTSNGRDKAFKIMQYSLRMYLLFHSSIVASSVFRGSQRSPWDVELLKRSTSAISGLSLTRKCLILFNWLTPLTSILAQRTTEPFGSARSSKAAPKPKPLLHTFLHASPPTLLELANGLSDDIYTFSRLGLIGQRTGERAGRFADWCWFVGTLVNLVENGVERGVILDLQHQVESRLYSESMAGATAKSNPNASKTDTKELERLQRQDYWIQVTRMKLLMDLVFVSYNVFRLNRGKSTVQTITGLASAALSTAKIYDRHKTVLGKTLKL